MMPTIDETEYQHGKTLFTSGKSIREMIEDVKDGTAGDEEKQISRLIGFADAFLELLRGPRGG